MIVNAADPVRHLGVDEKAFRKGHKYVTVVNDLTRGRVLYVAKDPSKRVWTVSGER
jgi:transposase